MKKFVVFAVLIPVFLGGCDFYTAYLIKKSLSGDFSFINEFSRKYKLSGESFSDIPVSTEEKILPEFVEDKVLLTDLEEQLIPGSKEKPSENLKIFSSKGSKVKIDLPRDDGVWIIKKLPSKISKLSKDSDMSSSTFIFEIGSYGTDNAIFNLISSNGIITKVLEYEIVSSNANSNTKDNDSISIVPKTNFVNNQKDSLQLEKSNNTTTEQKNTEQKLVSSNGVDNSSLKNATNKEFDLTDEEKQESIIEPKPPSVEGKFDIKTLVGDENKYFDYIDNIAKKYGYYAALKEIEKIETNIADVDLPKIKFKKMEIYDALGRYNDAINEGQEVIDKDNIVKLYVGIMNGKVKNYYIADKNIKESLNAIVEPYDMKFALDKVIDYYLSIPEPPTREMINVILQKNEFLQKNYKKDYQMNLIKIGQLFERIGDLYKAKAIYDQVYNQNPDEEVLGHLNEARENLEKVTNYK
ncbi:MAG: hypothetical protein ACP5KI_02675 [Brevinematia bacterium]